MPSVLVVSSLDACDTGFQAIPRLLAAFRSKGWAVTFFVLRDTPQSTAVEATNPVLSLPGIRVIRSSLPKSLFHGNPPPSTLLHNAVWTGRMGIRLLQADLEPHDVVYSIESVSAIGASLLGRKWQNPLRVHRFFGIADPSAALAMPRWRRWASSAALHQLGINARCDLLVMTDDGTMGDEVVRKHAPSNSKRLMFLPNGVDRPTCVRCRERTARSASDPLRVLIISRLVGWKRVHLGLRGLAHAKSLGTPIVARVVGGGPSRLALEDEADALGLSSTVEFVGMLPQDDVWRQYEWADVLVSTYDWSNVGNPLLEAFSMGLPVITVPNGGTANWVQNGVNGILCSLDEERIPYEVGESLRRLKTNCGLISQLSRGAEQLARERIRPWEARLHDEVEEITRRLIDRRAPNRG